MSEITANPMLVWLIIGIVLIIGEIFFITGIGALFAGLAAISTAILIFFNIINVYNTAGQIAGFCLLTFIWATLLWRSLQKIYRSKTVENYHNIIGESAMIVEKDLVANKLGKAKWSGTIMNTKLADHDLQTILVNTEVEIINIIGNTLIVKNRIKHD